MDAGEAGEKVGILSFSERNEGAFPSQPSSYSTEGALKMGCCPSNLNM
jgi:hypothetical protein